MVKNAKEPRCWKWWSLEDADGDYWTVDMSEMVHVLLKMSLRSDEDWNHEHVKYLQHIHNDHPSMWKIESICNTEDEQHDFLNEYSIKTILKIDKLFGSSFARYHLDYILPTKKQKQKSEFIFDPNHPVSSAGLMSLMKTIQKETLTDFMAFLQQSNIDSNSSFMPEITDDLIEAVAVAKSVYENTME